MLLAIEIIKLKSNCILRIFKIIKTLDSIIVNKVKKSEISISENETFEEVIDKWYSDYSLGKKEPFPLEIARVKCVSESESETWKSGLEIEESAYTEILQESTIGDSTIVQENIPLDEQERKEITLYITILFKAPLSEDDDKINKHILGALINFGINIGKKALIVKYIRNLISNQVDFTRNINIIKKLSIKLKNAPYLVFSRKPLDDIKSRSDKKDIAVISLNIRDERVFRDLLNDLQSRALESKYPSRFHKVKKWLGEDHIYLKMLCKAFEELLKYLNEYKNLIKPLETI